VLKLLRKVQAGIHPDAEMVRYLVAGGFENVPAILGEVWLDEGAASSLVMLVQRFVYNQGDGWAWTLGLLERLATDADWSSSNYENFAQNVGRRLAEMHAVLARPSDDGAFAPEALTLADADRLSGRIEGQLDKALGMLGGVTLGESDAAAAAYLRDHREALMARIRQAAREGEGRTRTRIHGDLHLGQMLVTGSDVMLIDFEGEPVKSLDDRRAKDMPERDVAGMLRSFDYAAAVAERARPALADADEARTDARYDEFRRSAAEAFLTGYREVTAMHEPLLDLFVLEKAAYEVAYEAANRPDWIGVPIAGLARAAERLLQETAA
jgi:maltose alpha-D-glucosyltransferase/alpha-amylase